MKPLENSSEGESRDTFARCIQSTNEIGGNFVRARCASSANFAFCGWQLRKFLGLRTTTAKALVYRQNPSHLCKRESSDWRKQQSLLFTSFYFPGINSNHGQESSQNRRQTNHSCWQEEAKGSPFRRLSSEARRSRNSSHPHILETDHRISIGIGPDLWSFLVRLPQRTLG